VPPGRWFWSCFTSNGNVAVSGVLEIAPGTSSVRIAPRVAKVPREQAAKGIVWEELDGRDLRGVDARYRTWPFGKDGDVLVRDGARWSAIP
jgi:hypothetical protein